MSIGYSICHFNSFLSLIILVGFHFSSCSFFFFFFLADEIILGAKVSTLLQPMKNQQNIFTALQLVRVGVSYTI